jgi:hypothetical protein
LPLGLELVEEWKFQVVDDGGRLVCFSRYAYRSQQTARAQADELAGAISEACPDAVREYRTWTASYLDPPGRWRGVVEVVLKEVEATPPVPA